MPKTNLAQALEITNDASAYDTNVKYLLSDKQILARVLKYAVREFAELPVEEIMESIGDDIEVESKPEDPGLSNLGRIRGTNTEDSVPGEGSVIYDIRFSAYHKKEEMKFLLNIEAQKSLDPGKLGYHLENRITFYLARMISAQKQTEFFHSDYDSLKRVRSIWICMDSRTDGDSIEEIGFEKKEVFGNSARSYDLDLVRAIIVNIRSSGELTTSRNVLTSMLETLFAKMDLDNKKQVLTENYGMIMTTKLEERLQIMCNLSENIIEYGLEKGMTVGREQGRKEGRKEERMNAIERMIRAGATKEQILIYGYSEEEYGMVERSL